VFRSTPRARRTFPRLLAAFLVLGTLGGCASDKVSKSIAQGNATLYDTYRLCIETAYNSPSFAAARRRLPADIPQATLEQETDPSIATDPEIYAVLLTQPQLHTCRQAFLDKINASTPSLLPIYANTLSLNESSLYEVLQKKKSWGDHVRDMKILQTKAAGEVAQGIKKLADGLDKEPKAVQARREAADQALDQYALTQKALTTMRRPIISH
jgi:hypothetical protein